LSQRDLETVLRDAKRQQQPAKTLLMARYKLSKQEIGVALCAFYRCPFKEYDEKHPPAWDALRGINLNYLKANFWIPLLVTDKYVEVLIDDPQAYEKIRDIKRLFPERDIRCCVGLRDDILRYVNGSGAKGGQKNPHESINTILGQLDDKAQEDAQDELEGELVTSETHSAIVRLVNKMISDASAQRASDIHIEPEGGQNETRVRFRIDGHCVEYLRVPAAYRRALVSRFKIMAGLDISERRKPQDGKIKMRLLDREIELRVATLPTAGIGNEDVVLRILTAGEPMSLNQLRMTPRNCTNFACCWRSLTGSFCVSVRPDLEKRLRFIQRLVPSTPRNARFGRPKTPSRLPNEACARSRSIRRLGSILPPRCALSCARTRT